MKNTNAAEQAYLKAIALAPQAIYFEGLDEILDNRGADVKYRFDILNKHHSIIVKRYYPAVAEIATATFLGKYDYALELLRNGYYPTGENVKNFHDLYADALVLAALEKSAKGDNPQAIKLLQEAFTYPDNHQVFLYDTRTPRDSQVYYYLGTVYEKTGDKTKAQENYRKAVENEVGKTDYRGRGSS